jgi:hypothetical protein
MRHGGLAKHARYFYPSSRDLVPFVVLLAVHTAYNPDTILGCTHDDISFEPGVGAARVVVEPSLANVDGDPAAERVKAKAFKGRARAKQPRSFPVTADPDNPAELLAFLERWTDRIRPHVPPRYANRVFVFGTHRRARAATSYVNERGTLSNTVWKHSLKKFCRKHGLREFTLRQIRQTVIDLAHELSGGDLRAVLAVGGQRSADTINSHYTSSGARERNYEGLAAAGALMWRDRMARGRADARRAAEIGGDVGAATPGWGCLDPYDSPVPGLPAGAAEHRVPGQLRPGARPARAD